MHFLTQKMHQKIPLRPMHAMQADSPLLVITNNNNIVKPQETARRIRIYASQRKHMFA